MKFSAARLLPTLLALFVAAAVLAGVDAGAAQAAGTGKAHHSHSHVVKSKSKKCAGSKKGKKGKKSRCKAKRKAKSQAKATPKTNTAPVRRVTATPSAPAKPVALPPASTTGRNVSAGTFYVSTNGNDVPSAGSAANPWRTVQYAVDRAPANSAIKVAAGQYAPFVVRRPLLTIIGAGSTQSIIAGSTALRDNVLIDAGGVQVSSFGITNCIPKVVPGDGMENDGAASVAVTKNGTNSVVSGNSIVGQTGTNQYGLAFGCYGVIVRDAAGVLIDGNDISHGGYGVMLRKVGQGTVVHGNEIHDIDTMIRNTPQSGDDFGGSGVGLGTITSGSADIVDNRIHDNEAVTSHDYGTDGGGFDFFQSSNVSIRNNTIYNNENVLEGGAGSGGACNNDSFTGNTVTGKTAGRTLRMTVGMLMRCGVGMKVTGNTFTGLQWWTFAIEPQNGDNSMMRGLSITNNTMRQGNDLVWAIPVNPRGAQYDFSGNSYSYNTYLAQDWNGRKVKSMSDFNSSMASAA